MTDTTEVELPTHIVEEARERHEEYGFPTAEGMMAFALRNHLAEDPDISEEHRQELLESRRQLDRGEVYSAEKVFKELIDSDE